MNPKQDEPDYMIHERRYQARLGRPEYAGWFTEADYEQEMKGIASIIAQGHAPTSGKLLDLGCGAGNFSWRFARRGYDVTGVDISPTAIEWARRNVARAGVDVEFLTENVVQLEGPAPASFDFAFDGHLLHCLIGPDRRQFLGRVAAILRSGGYFLVRSMVWPMKSGGDLAIDPNTRIGYLDRVPYRYYPSAEQLVGELRDAGFEVVDWMYTVTLDDGYGFQHAVMQCRVPR